MNLDAGWFFSWIKGSGHVSGEDSALGFAVAAIARRNRIPVRAGLRMTEESADTLIEFRADDVFEAASLRMRLGFVDGKSVLKEPLGKAVAAADGTGPTAAAGSALRFA